ncbi:MAG TPA: bifunctional diaminohydroxyphosphoribosylaminopyrimidine deaminase/5-amino-6-(5-phosphoribosylamino)uracil reductase RibD [Rhodanobacteraceae bacterium]|nr:bifunctional diaminohydroxyphosphoribosylaminopyrimidine deaminase/5-amino-6-(5-phosphoribosylamino)uracil reductase RibD [Rhodanobacteraceae bacterium]
MSDFSAIDHAFMARALRLAQRGLYTTQPNPRVGCVIARGGEIVGEGWHQRAGEPHAEVFALRAAGERGRGATAYVTLEPCAHYGRTPPCADALVEDGIARVVAACEDPNPKTAGSGLRLLREAGIEVQSGLMCEAARELNRGFLSRMERGRPWVRVKLAMSLDGRTALANGESKWITGEVARADVQRWRARSSAILTGAGTARTDNPRLTVRLPAFKPLSPLGRGQGEGAAKLSPKVPPHPNPLPDGEREKHFGASFVSPLRVVLDPKLDALQSNAHLFDGSAPTLVLHAPGAQPSDDRYAQTELAAIELDSNGKLDLHAVMRLLAQKQINELQVEAGPRLCGALFEAGLVDELLLYVAPVLLGDSARPLLSVPPLENMMQRRALRVIDQRRVGGDMRMLLRTPQEIA